MHYKPQVKGNESSFRSNGSTSTILFIDLGHNEEIFDSEWFDYVFGSNTNDNNPEKQRVHKQVTLFTKKIHAEKRRMEKWSKKIAECEDKLLMRPVSCSAERGASGNAASMKKQINLIG